MSAPDQLGVRGSAQEPVAFMQQVVNLDYKIVTSPVHRRFDELMREGRIVGHKCPVCGLVYVPPKGFCPRCAVVTTEEHEVEVKDTATVTSFTVITPIQYQGQQEKDEYVLANLLLDGSDSTIGQQRIEEIPHNEVRMGMRVKAVWASEEERSAEGGGMRGWGLTNAVKHWVPSGEPDLPREEYQEHVL
ncbi:MAG TPA: zinc ribbon domain-containing protein [Actinomycetota bacterium]|nr:zinc ribbon domain-containing protein [Actinomycetota bacterium]